jgi:hypothetical protein
MGSSIATLFNGINDASFKGEYSHASWEAYSASSWPAYQESGRSTVKPLIQLSSVTS